MVYNYNKNIQMIYRINWLQGLLRNSKQRNIEASLGKTLAKRQYSILTDMWECRNQNCGKQEKM